MQMDEARHSTLAILAAGECGGEVRAVSTVGAVGDDLMGLIPRLLGLWGSHPGLATALWWGGRRADRRPGLGSASESRDDLRPDRNHAQKQRQRGERGSFFNDGPDHDPNSCTTRTGHEHSSCSVPKSSEVLDLAKRDRSVGTEHVSPAPRREPLRNGAESIVLGGARPASQGWASLSRSSAATSSVSN